MIAITAIDRYILDCLSEIGYMRLNHIIYLCKLKSGYENYQIVRELDWLKREGLIIIYDEIVSLPNKQSDKQILSALDIMMQISGNNLPEFLAGTPPCILSFYIYDGCGYKDFKVAYVAQNSEHIVIDRLKAHYRNYKCTWLYLLESKDQIEILQVDNPAYFVVRNRVGGFDFLKKEERTDKQ